MKGKNILNKNIKLLYITWSTDRQTKMSVSFHRCPESHVLVLNPRISNQASTSHNIYTSRRIYIYYISQMHLTTHAASFRAL